VEDVAGGSLSMRGRVLRLLAGVAGGVEVFVFVCIYLDEGRFLKSSGFFCLCLCVGSPFVDCVCLGSCEVFVG